MPAAKLNPKEFKTKGPLVLQAAYRGDILTPDFQTFLNTRFARMKLPHVHRYNASNILFIAFCGAAPIKTENEKTSLAF
ncbi:hypothetical protein Y032_0349g3197 [Ancylostoma ceylanicum]|uniref:Uncharacterized protein n=1 Tax=Ancylostoma ceylanicum TaxID=53326 RepID=A0A016RWW6_9BILA|nr:hypothetical protein Y032_0349g3197 [Ancylostoma ceylanicum]